MNTAPNLGSILDAAPTEVERPKAIAAGSYITVVKGMPRYDKSSKKHTDLVEFTHQFVSGGEDVDEDALKESLTKADGTIKALSEVTMTNTFYLTENAVYRLDIFHEDCGLELEEDVSRRQRNEMVAGAQVGVYVRHVPTQDGKGVRAEIANTFAIED